MFELLREFRKIEHHVLYIIIAQFFLQMIGTSFLSIQPLYMKAEGYTDGLIAGHISFRFLGVLLLAFPLGFYIRSKKLIPLFMISGVCVPFFSLFIIFSIHNHISWLLSASQFLWGSSMIFMQASVIPYILRNAKDEYTTEAISLSYSTFSMGGIAGGTLIGSLHFINEELFSDMNLLILVSILGFLGLIFIRKISTPEIIPSNENKISTGGHDWGLILKALAPTLVIAVGAGLTIPFISLFFSTVHGLSTGDFAVMSAFSYIIVSLGYMLVPRVKKRIGYRIAIPGTQFLAIIALVLMATTQYYSHLSYALLIAIVFYLLRQPLMNMAQPMTTEIIMGYAGKKNREMVSALTGAAWSGSWYLSSIIFKHLRNAGLSYVNVFLITAAIYCVGVVWYYFLVVAYDKKKLNVNG